MAKKTRSEAEKDIQNRHIFKAMKLLLNPDYEADSQEAKDIFIKLNNTKKEKNTLEEKIEKKSINFPSTSPQEAAFKKRKGLEEKEHQLKLNLEAKEMEISNKYNIPYHYSIEELKEIIAGKSQFYEDLRNIVSVLKQKESKLVPYDAPNKRSKEELGSLMGIIDKEGYIYFKVKPTAPRFLLYELIDKYIDLYAPTKIKNEKFRKEGIDALKIWMERKLRKPFKQISKIFNISVSTAKKRYYRAYEILHDKKYNPAFYKKPEIKKEYLGKECSSCKERETCEDLCPDVILLVGQDTKDYQREMSMLNLQQAADPDGPSKPAKGEAAKIKGITEMRSKGNGLASSNSMIIKELKNN